MVASRNGKPQHEATPKAAAMPPRVSTVAPVSRTERTDELGWVGSGGTQ
jgi:hypothetical protein